MDNRVNGKAPIHLVALGVNQPALITEQNIREAEVQGASKMPSFLLYNTFSFGLSSTSLYGICYICMWVRFFFFEYVLAEPDIYRRLALRPNQA